MCIKRDQFQCPGQTPALRDYYCNLRLYLYFWVWFLSSILFLLIISWKNGPIYNDFIPVASSSFQMSEISFSIWQLVAIEMVFLAAIETGWKTSFSPQLFHDGCSWVSASVILLPRRCLIGSSLPSAGRLGPAPSRHSQVWWGRRWEWIIWNSTKLFSFFFFLNVQTSLLSYLYCWQQVDPRHRKTLTGTIKANRLPVLPIMCLFVL